MFCQGERVVVIETCLSVHIQLDVREKHRVRSKFKIIFFMHNNPVVYPVIKIEVHHVFVVVISDEIRILD